MLFGVTTCPENLEMALEMSGNLRAVREMSGGNFTRSVHVCM